MYRFLNKNALGKFEDDCVIRSISCATNKSWDTIYEILSDTAQEHGTMMDDRDFVIHYLDRHFIRLSNLKETVGEVSYQYKNDIVLITMPGHITCSKYGTIYDTFDCRDRIAEFAWLVV